MNDGQANGKLGEYLAEHAIAVGRAIDFFAGMGIACSAVVVAITDQSVWGTTATIDPYPWPESVC